MEGSSADDCDKEDGGQAIIITLNAQDDEPSGLFVRLQSWDPEKKHTALQPFLNKRLRVTVEVIGDL